MNIGKAIKLCRKQSGLSQAKLADEIGVSVSHISLVECGKRDIVMSKLEAIAQALEVPLPIIVFLSADEQELAGLGEGVASKLASVALELMKRGIQS